ncbi:MAG: VOC family protein [Alphaproteobacteria bacterium]|nr:VOC family protein [Alphaproteobacteria bacterium]
MARAPKTLSFSHVGIYVRDLETMVAFYKRVFGFVETDRGVVRGHPIVFLSRDPSEHHQIVMAEGRTGDPDDLVLNQISLRTGALQDLRDLLAVVEAEPAVSDIRPVSHGNAWSIYFRDPEKNRIEVFVDTPWYSEQPVLDALDLSLSDEEIRARTLAGIEGNSSFKPIEAWREGLARKLEDASA